MAQKRKRDPKEKLERKTSGDPAFDRFVDKIMQVPLADIRKAARDKEEWKEQKWK